MPAYAAAARDTPTANEVQRRHLILRAQFYVDRARSGAGLRAAREAALASDGWANESTADLVLYMRRQILRANLEMGLDDYAAADRTLSKLLSLIASLENPEEKAFETAYILSDAIAVMLSIGQTERAYGLYAASRGFIVAALPPRSVDAIVFRLTEAQLLQEMDSLPAAQRALDDALAKATAIELDEPVRTSIVAQALTLKSVIVFAQGDLTGARAVLDSHPYKARFTTPRAADGYGEVGYLAARAVVSGALGESDPVAAQALAAPQDLESQSLKDVTEAYRAVGLAVAMPPGADREKALAAMGPRIIAMAAGQPRGGFGAWYRPGVVDRTLLSLALAQDDKGDPRADAANAFALLQLAGRNGGAFDSDALTVLGQAKDPAARRSIHQALRLKARRDQIEREGVRKVALRAQGTPMKGERWLRHDLSARAGLRGFNQQLDELQTTLASDGVITSGANLVPLDRFQTALRDDEVALAVSPVANDAMAYMCIRRGATQRSVLKADLAQARLDAKIIQAGLTAGHAPSEVLDAQFPAAAAVRLYDVLIRPFGDCLRPGDHILWLPKLVDFTTPLAVLLAQAPPKLGAGYDLAAADWLARTHAITYAGSPSVVVAARAGREPGGDFDFLGVGDPVLTGTTADGDSRGAAVLRGVRGGTISSLAPLPETRDELQQSAQGFATARLLMGEDATEDRLRGELVGSYRYLSFATHGLLREDLAGLAEPALVLTAGSSQAGTDDGLLTATEIADLRLTAGFVALSACNTANFDLTQFSQDLPALASAFAVAGVPATLATLWPVESETSKRVVARAFEILRTQPGLGPAEALAQAQRAFLDAPPGKAYLHPRFWAPFVVLGDGGASGAPRAGALKVAATQVLTRGGGEAVAASRMGQAVAVRLVAEPKGGPRHTSSVQRLGDKAWRTDNGDIAASAPLVEVGPQLIAGGYRKTQEGDFAATLQAFDRETGALTASWQAPLAEGIAAALLGGAAKTAPDRIVFAVKDIVGKSPTATMRMRVFEADASLRPRELFALDLPGGGEVLESSLTRAGGDIVLTYSIRASNERQAVRADGDDYDPRSCRFRSASVVERRDARTGALKTSKTLEGYVITSAVAGSSGAVMLAGSFATDCASQGQAVVVALDPSLSLRTVYRTEDRGFSEVRAAAATPDGGLLLAINMANLLDYSVPEGFDRAAARPSNPRRYMSAAAVVLDARGRVRGVAMLDAGSDLFVSTAEASRAGDMIIGGSIGGEAALIRLALKRP